MIDPTYTPEIIEPQVQKLWHDTQAFSVAEDLSKEKFYCLAMFPYPSGRLHMGHVRNYTLSDVIARYQRMLGKNVLQPMGWDAFGLPAENAAIEKQVPPAKWTYDNIKYMREQFKRLGFAYDWKRELATCQPDYYRWEQWVFTRLYEKGLAYKKNAMVNWDPVDKTVLANEQVINGRGWRSGAIVERREIPQWFFKITQYAEELLSDLDKLTDWPEQVVTMQRNWIGKSVGVTIEFKVKDYDVPLEVFTTRADTFFGATYLAVAAEHPLVKELLKNPNSDSAFKNFIEECQHIPTAEAALATIEKKGMDTGLKAIHPLTGELLPVWVANFVVMEYGSGAVMSVPAHDQRDFEFAQKYGLPIIQVIQAKNGLNWDFAKGAMIDKGILVNSGAFSELDSDQAIDRIAEELVKLTEKGNIRVGKTVHYRLRDWGVSRQRYWGAPIPMINCPSCGPVPVPAHELPVLLPEDMTPTAAGSPLKISPDFYQTVCPNCHEPATRETDTFDTFVESSWYFARFACYNQENSMLDDRARYWMSVDQYVGGIEHAVLHLLYSRFITKVLRDEGLMNVGEPFKRLLTQGMVLKDGVKMSKSKGNIVDPEGLIEKYGADTVRLFMIFAAPPEQALDWSDSGVEGSHRFLKRLWTLAHANAEFIEDINAKLKGHLSNQKVFEGLTPELLNIRRQIHENLQQAKYDYERQQFNTVASSCMKILNLLSELDPAKVDEIQRKNVLRIIHEGLSFILCLLAPIVPHVSQALWQGLGYGESILIAPWPKISQDALKLENINLLVQVNGKLRAQVLVPADANQEMIEKIIFADAHIQPYLVDKQIKKIILVPNKLINIVLS